MSEIEDRLNRVENGLNNISINLQSINKTLSNYPNLIVFDCPHCKHLTIAEANSLTDSAAVRRCLVCGKSYDKGWFWRLNK